MHQEQNKQIVINEINARLDEIWSVEDDAACKALYLNTDIRSGTSTACY